MKGKRSVDTMVRLHPGDAAMNRNINRWNNDEMQIAVKGFRRHGKNFQAIAEILGTKNEQQLRSFYANYRKKYFLDDIIKEYDEEQSQRQLVLKALSDAEQKQSNKSSESNGSDIKKPLDSYGDVMEVSGTKPIYETATTHTTYEIVLYRIQTYYAKNNLEQICIPYKTNHIFCLLSFSICCGAILMKSNLHRFRLI